MPIILEYGFEVTISTAMIFLSDGAMGKEPTLSFVIWCLKYLLYNLSPG